MHRIKTLLFPTVLFFVGIILYYLTQLYVMVVRDCAQEIKEAPGTFILRHLPIAFMVALVVAYLFANMAVYKPVKSRIHVRLPSRFRVFFDALMIAFGWFLMASVFLELASRQWPNTFIGSQDNPSHVTLSLTLVLSVVVIGIIAPLFEEVFFRGLLMRRLSMRLSKPKTIIIQAVLFGVFHLNLAQSINTMFIGLYLGIMLVWTRSLFVPWFAHMVNNVLSIVFGPTLFMWYGLTGFAWMIIGNTLLGVVLCTLGFKHLYNHRNVKDQDDNANV